MSVPQEEKASRSPGGQTRTRTTSTLAGHAAGELVSEQGKTSIADTVVAKVVGMAVREIPGIYGMGAGLARTLGTVRERLPGVSAPGITHGVSVEVGERQTAVDLDVIIEYGVSIPDVAAGVRRNVIDAVEKMCGLDVVEVNITVDDVHMPDEADEGDSRVE